MIGVMYSHTRKRMPMKCWMSRKYTLRALSISPSPSANSAMMQRQQQHEGQEHQRPPVAERQQGHQQEAHLDEVGHQVGPDRGGGQQLAREVGLLDERLVAHEAADAGQ